MLKRTSLISGSRSHGSTLALLVGSLTLGCGADGIDALTNEDVSSVSEALCTVSPLSVQAATASSVENASLPASAAIDGNGATRWSSQFSDPQWLRVDLGQPRYIDNVVLSWEAASAADYVLQLSMDDATWTTVKTVTNAAAGARTDSLLNLSQHEARYVRVHATRRTTPYGYSLFEIKVNGDPSPTCATGTWRNISGNLEAESNDGMSGLQYENTADTGGGRNAGWVDPGDYVEWKIQVPTAGNYALTSRSATVAPAGAQVLVDGALKSTVNLPSSGGYQNWTSITSSAFNLSAGNHTLRFAFTTASQNLNWVKVAAAGVTAVCGNGVKEAAEACDDGNTTNGDGCSSTCRVESEYEIGSWRLVAKSDLQTLTRDPSTGVLQGLPYTGDAHQHLRLRYAGPSRYELALEGTTQCLVSSGSSVALGACGNSAVYWTLDTLRLRSESQPALHRWRSPANTCLTPGGASAPTLGACTDAANWYVEPVGWDERSKPVEYDLRALLIVKPVTTSSSIGVNASIPADAVAAVQTLYKGEVANWFRRITDGRVRWTADSVVSPDAMTTFYFEGGNYLPIPDYMQPDIQRYVPRGKYDTVAVVYTTGNQPGGWGWGPGVNPLASYAAWVTVNGTYPTASDWGNGRTEPMQVFIHEPMHGLDGYFYQKGSVPLPEGWLHGGGLNAYAEGQLGWLHWYRDYLLGTVIDADGTYRGYGPRAFRLPTIRQDALTH